MNNNSNENNISKEILYWVNTDMRKLTDEQLSEALIHYCNLERLLHCHNNIYFLCWQDVNIKLALLRNENKQRKEKSMVFAGNI